MGAGKIRWKGERERERWQLELECFGSVYGSKLVQWKLPGIHRGNLSENS